MPAMPDGGHPNSQLIDRFYSSFQRKDGEAMVGCYSDEVEFSDPVFTHLDATHAKGMWRMFCSSDSAPQVTFSSVIADDERGSADWEAIYQFRGRRVHNRIHAEFEFRSGLIHRHRDSFDLWRWASMALGPIGMLLGWSAPVQSSIRAQAKKALAEFLAGRAEGAER
jgi:ketosteroid isomerase-like protein